MATASLLTTFLSENINSDFVPVLVFLTAVSCVLLGVDHGPRSCRTANWTCPRVRWAASFASPGEWVFCWSHDSALLWSLKPDVCFSLVIIYCLKIFVFVVCTNWQTEKKQTNKKMYIARTLVAMWLQIVTRWVDKKSNYYSTLLLLFLITSRESFFMSAYESIVFWKITSEYTNPFPCEKIEKPTQFRFWTTIEQTFHTTHLHGV